MTVTFTVTEVRSPHAWPSQVEWGAANYDFNLSYDSGYKMLQAIIADSDGDFYADAPGLWRSGNKFHDMLCQYSRSDTVGLTCPSEWLDFVLQDMGVSADDIDGTSFTAAATIYSTAGITFNGGFFQKDSRERWLANLLVQTDSRIKLTDKVELYQFSATPQETFTTVLSMSFRPARISGSSNDGIRVHWPESLDKPMDVFGGKAVVPTHSGAGATTNNPSSAILKARFLVGQSQHAQRAGELHAQKRFAQKNRVSFRVAYTDITARATLSPGDVVTVNNSIYGGSRDIVVTEMRFNRDLSVEISGIELYYLEDWGGIPPDTVTVTEDPVQEAYPAVEGEDPSDITLPGDYYFTAIDNWLLGVATSRVRRDQIFSFEAATGGMCTILRDEYNNDNYMRLIGYFDHPAFDIGADYALALYVGMFLSSFPPQSIGDPGGGGGVAGHTLIPCSLPNSTPYLDWNLSEARTNAELKGTGWHVLTNWEWAAITHYVMENCGQPTGNTNGGLSHTTSYESGVPYECDAAITLTGTGPKTWRHDGTPSGIADMVGNVWEWVDGLYLVNGDIHLPETNQYSLAPASWTNTGVTLPASSPWKNMTIPAMGTVTQELLEKALVVPYQSVDPEDPDGDYAIPASPDPGTYAAMRGGDNTSGTAAGLGALKFQYAPDYAVGDAGVGFRVAYIGPVCTGGGGLVPT